MINKVADATFGEHDQRPVTLVPFCLILGFCSYPDDLVFGLVRITVDAAETKRKVPLGNKFDVYRIITDNIIR